MKSIRNIRKRGAFTSWLLAAGAHTNVFSRAGPDRTRFHHAVIRFISLPSENHIQATQNPFETTQPPPTVADLQFRFKINFGERKVWNIKYPPQKVQKRSWLIACRVNSEFSLITYLKCRGWFARPYIALHWWTESLSHQTHCGCLI